MKIISVILAILLFGQSLRAGTEVLCCQTQTKTQHTSCSEVDKEVIPITDIEQSQEESGTQKNCSECHCPGCLVVTTTLTKMADFPNIHLPNFANPSFFYKGIYTSDYTFSPWQPPQILMSNI